MSCLVLGFVRRLVVIVLLFLVCKGGGFLGGSSHDSVGFSQRAITGVAVAHMFFPVHAHVCSTEAGCSSMGPRWLIYPILSCTLTD